MISHSYTNLLYHGPGLETNAHPLARGDWNSVRASDSSIRPDQPGGQVEILWGFIDQVIASLALISSVLSRQNEILNRVRLFEQALA